MTKRDPYGQSQTMRWDSRLFFSFGFINFIGYLYIIFQYIKIKEVCPNFSIEMLWAFTISTGRHHWFASLLPGIDGKNQS
jgi:hypothetical protein